MILNDFIHVYSPRAATDNPLGTKFWCQQKFHITLPICCQFKKNLFEVWFFTSFYIYVFNHFIHVHSPGARAYNPLGTNVWCQQKALITLGQTIHWGQNFDDNKKAFSLCPYVASFKMISSKSDCIHIFNDFIALGQGQKTPWGQTFVNRKPLSLQPFVASFKQISLNSDFIHIF